jgi:iron-only hydrogenase group A
VCEEVEGVGCIDFIGRGSATTVGPALDQGLNVSSCVNCGQCIMVCPTGALSEHSNLPPVLAALGDPGLTVVVQHAPAVALTLGEEFGLKPGADVAGLLNAALRRLGFARVYETAFSADLTVMEEASELVQRIRNGGTLPMMTSCSPGWIKYVEQFHPEFIPNLSTCKSPQMMLGALVKSPLSAAAGLDPERVFSVSVMPCVAKKFEAARPELHTDGVPDVDAVLTTRELVTLLRQRGLDLARLEPEPADDPFGARSTAGRLFAGSGGVMESAVRTAHWLLTGRDLAELRVQAVRSGEGVRECRVKIDGLEIGAAVVSGLSQAKELLKQLGAGRSDLHFIEVMTCPGGCLNGGGQVRAVTPDAVRARQQALYALDREGALRTAHANESIRRLYDDFLGAPLGELSHRYLHTHYAPREVVR